MKYITILILIVLSFSAKAQIEPYQIVSDALGAHRILMTDSTGEYVRVSLIDAIVDSLGVGKFVDGTVATDAVYTGGNVGIGTVTPDYELDVVGDIQYSGTLYNGPRQEYSGSNFISTTQEYTGAFLDTTYFVGGEYQKVVTIIPSGGSKNYHITGKLYAQNAQYVQIIDVDVVLRSNTLPDLGWSVYYKEDNNGFRYIKPFIWTKETTTAGFIFGFEALAGVTIYGSVTADLKINSRSAADKANVTINTVKNSEQITIDAGYTSQTFTKRSTWDQEKMGIGVDNPLYTLDISGTLQASGNTWLNGTVYVDGTSEYNDDATFQGSIFSNSTLNASIIKVADRIGGAATKSVYFDALNQIIEGPIVVDTDTQLTEIQVDAYADNNGYLEVEVDGSITNEIQTISEVGAIVTLSNGGGSFTDTDTDTQLSEVQVDAYADNNGYLEVEVDGSITNEIQTISEVGAIVTLSNGGGSFTDTDTDTQLTEIQVDAYADNNGYLEVEVDGSITNEIQDLTLVGNTLAISSDPNTDVDLSGFVSTDDQTINIVSDILYIEDGNFVDLSSYSDGKFVDGTVATDAVYTGGNVGVGTVTPSTKLHIWMDDIGVADTTFLTVESGYSTDNNIFEIGTKVGNGYLRIKDTADISKVEILSQGNSYFNGGNVGIGTATPNTTLDIIGTLRSSGNAFLNGTVYVDGTSEYNGDATFQGSIFSNSTLNADIIKVGDRIGGAATKSVYFDALNQLIEGPIVVDTDTQLTEIQVDAYANNNGYLLTEVDGSITNELQTISKVGNTVTLSNGGGSFIDTTGKFVDGTATLDAVYTAGNVGIGTATPTALLHVKSTGNGEIEVERNLGALINIQAQSARGVIGTDSNHELDLKTNATTRVRILSNGNVGINETAPTQSLSVNGAFSGEYPKNSGLSNAVFGSNNLGAQISGADNFVSGNGNLTLVTGPTRSTVQGYQNAPSVSSSSYNTIFGYRNMYSNTASSSYNTMSGYNNLYNAIGTSTYNTMAGGSNAFTATTASSNTTFFGRENAYFSSAVGNSTMIGYRNMYTNTGAATNNQIIGYGNLYLATSTGMSYNNIMGYQNAYNASDVDFTNLFGFQNAYSAGNLDYTTLLGRENGYSSSGIVYSFMAGIYNARNASSTITDSALFGRQNAMNGFDIQYSTLSGFDNAKAAQYIRNSSLLGRENAPASSSVQNSFFSGYRNAYTTLGSADFSIVMGYQNGYLPTVALDSTILLGFRQGYTIGSKGAASNRLAIGMIQDTPLIYGEFNNKVVEIDGNLTITDRVGAANKLAAFDTNGKLVETDAYTLGYGGLESNLVTISSTAATQIVFANTFGTATNTTAASDTITVLDAGIWDLDISGSIGSYTTSEILQVQIYINGVSDRFIKIKIVDINSAISTGYPLSLAANDKITIKLDSTTDASYTYNDMRLILNRIN